MIGITHTRSSMELAIHAVAARPPAAARLGHMHAHSLSTVGCIARGRGRSRSRVDQGETHRRESVDFPTPERIVFATAVQSSAEFICNVRESVPQSFQFSFSCPFCMGAAQSFPHFAPPNAQRKSIGSPTAELGQCSTALEASK